MPQPPFSWTLLLATILSACGGGDSTAPSESYSGAYTLRTVNGQSLPFLILQVGTDKFEAISGVLTMTDNGSSGGTFTSQLSLRSTIGGQVTTETDSDAGSRHRAPGNRAGDRHRNGRTSALHD